MDSLVEVNLSDGSVETVDLSTTEGKMVLAKELLKTPQMSCGVIHRFGPGIYMREAHYTKGTFIVGMEHLTEHTNVLLSGSINVIDANENVKRLDAPYIFVAKSGSKIGFCLTDVVWQNVYATEERDASTIERQVLGFPEMWERHLRSKLIKEYLLHEEDRQDFLKLVQESGWVLEDIETCSRYRDDCIPLPYGGYSFIKQFSPIEGEGLFCTMPIYQEQIVAPMSIGGKRTPAGYLVNHSKTPNCKAVKASNGDLLLVTKRYIDGMVGGDVGEELTLDYRQVMKLNGLWKGK